MISAWFRVRALNSLTNIFFAFFLFFQHKVISEQNRIRKMSCYFLMSIPSFTFFCIRNSLYSKTPLEINVYRKLIKLDCNFYEWLRISFFFIILYFKTKWISLCSYEWENWTIVSFVNSFCFNKCWCPNTSVKSFIFFVHTFDCVYVCLSKERQKQTKNKTKQSFWFHKRQSDRIKFARKRDNNVDVMVNELWIQC